MKLKIDLPKLEALIKHSVSETADGYWTSEEFCIGSLQGLQVIVKVTKDEYDYAAETVKFNCITEV